MYVFSLIAKNVSYELAVGLSSQEELYIVYRMKGHLAHAFVQNRQLLALPRVSHHHTRFYSLKYFFARSKLCVDNYRLPFKVFYRSRECERDNREKYRHTRCSQHPWYFGKKKSYVLFSRKWEKRVIYCFLSNWSVIRILIDCTTYKNQQISFSF